MPRIAWVDENDARGQLAEIYAEAHGSPNQCCDFRVTGSGSRIGSR